ncbi:cation diffusion facilitator family transporter [Methanobrevibacter sp. YE315]|uniref:cation diffusion facilitator family transporter n=1 Tax=Methanobrevibacter sp. YE315 TaxID=1609968 RepID=UPI000764D685|nr:cation diffusion facilitator family transporter [Methanobrevibacter sp. YE315]AMD17384.1 cation diffusion facilitator family transporter [Methanobrevibacter sp. YE315]
MTRQDKIVKTSIIGIVVNLILVAFKATIGILVNSIAITLDAVNNLTDALSSIITIIGTKLAGKAPDKSHPYGYGRIEYFSSVIIAAIVLWAGITALMESWPKIFNPDVTSYTTVSLIIIAVAVVVKFLLGRYVKGVGESINSQALVASGSDAFFDAILSFSTLLAAIISIFFHISLEGILGVIISLVIIKASIDMLRETIDSMIGERVDSELSKKIKDSICEVPGIYGAYDLTLHNYGPEQMQGSVHIEVDDSLSALDIHTLTRNLAYKIYEEFSIILTFGIYSRNDKYKDIREDLEKIADEYEEVIEIHGFLVSEEKKLATFDIIVDFDADREKIKGEIISKIKAKHPEFDYFIIDDYDVSD